MKRRHALALATTLVIATAPATALAQRHGGGHVGGGHFGGGHYSGHVYRGGHAYGGGICVTGGSVSLSSDIVEYNSASNGSPNPVSAGNWTGLGGGIDIAPGATVTLSNDTVEFNTVSPGVN